MSAEDRGLLAFALVYLTFFLDNVLLTVLVPIIPDWVRGGELVRWAAQDAPPPLAALLNHTVRHAAGIAHVNDTHVPRTLAESIHRGGSTAVVGVVLGAKAAAQLVASPWAARAACGGAARALAAGTGLLAAAAGVFAACGAGTGGAWCAGAGRVLHGAGSALAGVAGLALAATCAPQRLPALLGAVALGVLVGYPAGGLLDAAGSFLLLAALLLADLALQYAFLRKEEFNRVTGGGAGVWAGARAAAGTPPAAACAGCVLLTTCVMAALEPTLPPWIRERFHPQRWQTGFVFVPDSAGYLLATTCAGPVVALGAERVALAGQAAVGLAALALPHAPSVWWLALPHMVLGGGLGSADAALVPALLARAPRRVPHLAALLQAASSAAYALGPALGGLLAWRCGFATALRVLGAFNLLYAVFLYTRLRKHPLSAQWGAGTPEDEDSEACESGMESTPLRPRPGPGAYMLPTTVGFPQHDPSRDRAPMYSFGTRGDFRYKGLGPGPAYRIDRVTRDGVVSSPNWSFGARFPQRAPQRTPGPGAHAPERCPPQTARAPQYSMGARLGYGVKRVIPAPNAYAIRIGPGSPAWTMAPRSGYNLKSKSPGPAVYFQQDQDVYKSKPPNYSLGARLGYLPRAKTPGPAAYPPDLYNTKKNPYSYSFGIHHAPWAPPMIVKEDTMDCL